MDTFDQSIRLFIHFGHPLRSKYRIDYYYHQTCLKLWWWLLQDRQYW